jgi:hypothetical protein
MRLPVGRGLEARIMLGSCSRCGKPTHINAELCSECETSSLSVESTPGSVVEEDRTRHAATLDRLQRQVADMEQERLRLRGADLDQEGASVPLPPLQRRREGFCLTIGVLFSLIGVYFLLLAPSEGSIDYMGGSLSVVNMQRLYLGQTSAIVGAIFVAVGIRPR